MKRSYFLILIALALLLGAATGRSDEKHHNQASGDHRGGEYKPKVATPAFTIIVQPAPVTVVQPAAPAEKKHAVEKWYQRPTVTDWALFVVTFVYTLASLGLLNATRKQAILTNESLIEVRRQATTLEKTLVAAEKAADAAKQSADTADRALNDLERPWIFVGVTATRGWSRFWPANDTHMTITLRWYFRNYGRSPAFLIEGGGVELAYMNLWPDTPSFRHTEPVPLFPIPQGITNHREMSVIITREMHRELLTGDAFLGFFGQVFYRGTVGDAQYESSWVARMVVYRLVLQGHPESGWFFTGPPNFTNYT